MPIPRRTQLNKTIENIDNEINLKNEKENDSKKESNPKNQDLEDELDLIDDEKKEEKSEKEKIRVKKKKEREDLSNQIIDLQTELQKFKEIFNQLPFGDLEKMIQKFGSQKQKQTKTTNLPDGTEKTEIFLRWANPDCKEPDFLMWKSVQNWFKELQNKFQIEIKLK